jgi:glycosyltransferase involved in cell wall biosynthesis
MKSRSVLWWGRFDPDYSRNRILRQVLTALGWSIRDFCPRIGTFADWEATARGVELPDLVWVPCFRQRDLGAAHRWSRARGVPLLADPLISAFDKQVFERGKFTADSWRGRRLLGREREQLALPDLLLADTGAHADYFRDVLGVPGDKIIVVPVGAEEGLFFPAPAVAKSPDAAVEILFFGSFIPLQGPQVIIEAARRYRGPAVTWHLVGNGPLLAECRALAEGLNSVRFEDWVPYAELPQRIRRADLLLGVFGKTPKATRVIPNKVYQGAACGRPLVTMAAPAYPQALMAELDSGFFWVPPGDPDALAASVALLAARPERLPVLGAAARATYERYFSTAHIEGQLATALKFLSLGPCSD